MLTSIYSVIVLALVMSTSTVYAGTIAPTLRNQLVGAKSQATALAPSVPRAQEQSVRIIAERLTDADWIYLHQAFGAKIQHRLYGLDAAVMLVPRSSVAAVAAQLSERVIVRQSSTFVPLLNEVAALVDRSSSVQEATRTYDNVAIDAAEGRRAVVAIIDTGLDVQHQDFQDGNGKTRIIRYWDQTVNGPRIDPVLEGGTECSAIDIDAGQCDLDDEDASVNGIVAFGHGSHVAGIAASRHALYTGIAPGVGLIGVKAFFSEIDLILALNYVKRLHDNWGVPIVVNLSLGSNEGPRDGTTLIERWIAQHSGPGFVVIAAAGNESIGDRGGIHARCSTIDCAAQLNISALATTIKSSAVEAYAQGNANGDWQIGILSSTGIVDWVSFESTAMARQVTQALSQRAEVIATQTYNEEFDRTNYAFRVSAINGGNLQGLDIVFNYQTERDESVDFYVSDRRGYFVAGTQVVTVDDGQIEITGGTDLGNITNPGTSPHVITVGSYIGRATWKATGGEFIDGEVEPFQRGPTSSMGPTRDRRSKPDLTAPGQYVISTLSRNVSSVPDNLQIDDEHYVLFGTSMASPMVAGAAALMLGRDPTLNVDEIRELLNESADASALVTDGNPIGYAFGSGAVQIDQAVAAVPMNITDVTAPQLVSHQWESIDGDWHLTLVFNEATHVRMTMDETDVVVYSDYRYSIVAPDGFSPEILEIEFQDSYGNRGTAQLDGPMGCACQAAPDPLPVGMTQWIAMMIVGIAFVGMRGRSDLYT